MLCVWEPVFGEIEKIELLKCEEILNISLPCRETILLEILAPLLFVTSWHLAAGSLDASILSFKQPRVESSPSSLHYYIT